MSEAPLPAMSSKRQSITQGEEEEYQEFNDLLNEYYLKIGYNSDQKLFLICYNTKLLDNIRYEGNFSIKECHELSQAFKSCTKIKKIYEIIITIIKDGKFKIVKNSKSLDLIISLSNILGKIINVSFQLNGNNPDKGDELIYIISNEIKNLRNKKEELENIKNEQNNLKNEIEELKKLL